MKMSKQIMRRMAMLATCGVGMLFAAGESQAATVVTKLDQAALAKDTNGTLQFASEELKQLGTKVPGNEKATFHLTVNEKLSPFTFSIDREGEAIVLAGHGAAETLTAAYTALEQMGYRFDVIGAIAPAKLDVAKVIAKQVITPAIERRGVRQHINFACDLSAYPLNEAKEYIHQLARQRFNWIAFHSYPGQWNRVRYNYVSGGGPWKIITGKYYKDSDYTKGCLFYGAHFPIPDDKIVRATVRFNKNVFCIPELEPIYYAGKEREAFLTEWMRQVMAECKRAGMGVQFSTELQVFDEAENEKIANFIVEDYPQIDVLEFISREAGGDQEGDFEPWYLKNKAILDDVMTMADGKDADKKYPWTGKPDQTPNQVRDLGMALRTVKCLQAKGWDKQHKVQLAVGNYSTDEKMVRAVVKFADEYLPKDVWYTLMPGHSSRVVADHFIASQMSKELLSRTVLYSWFEFDGYMALQQFACSGFIKTLDQVRKTNGGKPMHALLANHWRTGENFMSLRCLDDLSFNAELTQESYVSNFARSAGISDASGFQKAMSEIDELSDLRVINGNIGFNIGWNINPKDRNVAGLWWWSKDNNQKAADRFQAVAKSMEQIKSTVVNPDYAFRLKLMANRCDASYAHLKAVRILQDCIPARFDRTTHRMPDPLTDEEKSKINTVCADAQTNLDHYLQRLAEMPVDRSAEGFMLYYYRGPWMLAHNMKAQYGGVGEFIPDPWDSAQFVPLPLSTSERNKGIEADKVQK